MELEHWIETLEQRSPACLEAKFEIVTPMFIGDGDQKARSVRSASVKGALRFWWRALNWGRCLSQSQGDTNRALKQLHSEEAKLFGAEAKTQEVDGQSKIVGGQGLFTLIVSEPEAFSLIKDWPKDGNAPCGFIGFGLWKTNKTPQREALAEGSRFSLRCQLKEQISPTQTQQLTDALAIFGLLGGLGSRARRGFGSLAIQELNGKSYSFKSQDEYIQVLKKHLGAVDLVSTSDINESPLSAWSSASSLCFYGKAPNARQALAHLSNIYKEARTGLSRQQKSRMGLPLADFDTQNRRSSPFILHIHPLGSDYLALISFLPAAFHPRYPVSQSELEQPLQRLKKLAQEKWL